MEIVVESGSKVQHRWLFVKSAWMVLADMDGVGVFGRKELKVRLDFDEIIGEEEEWGHERRRLKGCGNLLKVSMGYHWLLKSDSRGV